MPKPHNPGIGLTALLLASASECCIRLTYHENYSCPTMTTNP